MSLLCLKLPNGHHFSQNKSKKTTQSLQEPSCSTSCPWDLTFHLFNSLLISAHDFLVQRFTYCSVWTIFPLYIHMAPLPITFHCLLKLDMALVGFEKQPPLSYLRLGSEALLALRALVLYHPTEREKNARSSWPRSGARE